MLQDLYKFNDNWQITNPDELKPVVIEIAKRHKVDLNLEHPVTIQDKLSWLMLHDCDKLKTKCADKYLLREYCIEKLGVDICLPLLFVYNSTDEIKWSELPNEFVIKCNHGSGMNIVVRDKKTINKYEVLQKLDTWMVDNFALRNTYEAQYYHVPRKIVVEKLMTDATQNESLFDYKFWCFNGEPKFFTINDGHGHGNINHYKMDKTPYRELERADIKSDYSKGYKMPEGFDLMVEYAKKLSEPFKFVRVDFYEIGGKVYLGELTFTPGCGYFNYKSQELNIKIGNMLKI